jgi:hypothetical protein
MGNPELIVSTLDRHLDHPVRLVIYGRSAVWLGFEGSPPQTGMTLDVDAIISVQQESELNGDAQFWDAVESTNVALAPKGLYITHLFSEREVFLRQSWQRAVLPITRVTLNGSNFPGPPPSILSLAK